VVPELLPRSGRGNEPGRSSGLRAIGRAVETATDAGIPAECVVVRWLLRRGRLSRERVRCAKSVNKRGGLAALSGGLIGESIDLDDYVSHAAAAVDGDPADALAGTPAFLGCSDVDPHIPEERVHETADVLAALGGNVETRIYEGMGHGINEEGDGVRLEMVANLT